MGYQDGRRYGEDRYYADRDRGSSRYGANRDRYGSDERSYRYGTRGQFGGGGADYGRGRDDRYDRYDPEERGFFDRASDEVRSWFGDEEAERRREYDERYDREHDDSYRGGRYETTGDRGRYAQNRDDHGPGPRHRGPRDHGFAHHDSNYHSWRQARIDELDRDYAEYQNEHRDRFNTEFGSWRTRRGEQRQAVQQVREHMEVVGSDGEHVGTVDKLRGDRIILTKNDQDAGGIHHSVPSSWIKSVDATRVTLEKTADQAQTAWRTEREQNALFGDRDQQRDQQSSGQTYGTASASTTSYQTNRDR